MVREAGAAYLEAPVSGSKKPAEDGTLIFLAAGMVLDIRRLSTDHTGGYAKLIECAGIASSCTSSFVCHYEY